jgi:hypothetical protein
VNSMSARDRKELEKWKAGFTVASLVDRAEELVVDQNDALLDKFTDQNETVAYDGQAVPVQIFEDDLENLREKVEKGNLL